MIPPGYDLTVAIVDGARAAFVLPVVPEDAPADVREGYARRRLVMLTGRCPCGAQRGMPNRAERRRAAAAHCPARSVTRHEDGCPACDDVLRAAVERWRAS